MNTIDGSLFWIPLFLIALWSIYIVVLGSFTIPGAILINEATDCDDFDGDDSVSCDTDSVKDELRSGISLLVIGGLWGIVLFPFLLVYTIGLLCSCFCDNANR